MLKLGYQCQDFLNSTNSLNPSEEESRSRDLLLASGWIFSTQQVIDVMISEMQSLVDDEYYKVDHYEVYFVKSFYFFFIFSSFFINSRILN